ncbi:DNA-binding protein, partial [Streptomyces sp. UH6]|nr:DNA-binding protein [Streptomyces sp. UH6]
LRPAAGAAISRLREALAAVPGPLTLFSLQSNYLMGPPPATDALTAHPAVTEADDPVHDLRHLRVDPAALKGADDPVLDALDAYLDSVLPSQWLPGPSGLPALADLRLLLSEDFAALGEHLSADADRPAGWEQHPGRSVPHLVEECARAYGLGEDAAALHLMLLALPDPTDRNVKAWTGWKPARFKEAAAELAASGRVLRATRPRAGRSLFLPGAWLDRKPPRLPVEAQKTGLLPLAREHRSTSHLAAVPSVPLPTLFTRAWEGLAARRGRNGTRTHTP